MPAKRWIVTMGGIGYLPASGTFASLLTCLLLWPLLLAVGPNEAPQWAVALVGTVLFSALNVWLGPSAIADFGNDDPGQFVLDEAAGICLTLFLLPIGSGRSVAITLATAFLAFRIFDITKIPPIRRLENLPQGWGILTDDLAAAVYANILCQIFLRWILPALLR